MAVDPKICFQWSNQSYSLKQFETSFGDKLPQIVIIPDGHSAASNYYEFSADDTYFVKELVKQPRLVVQDVVGRHLSIPFDYPIKVHVVNETGKGESIVGPAEKLGDIMRRNGNSLANIRQIVFQHNESINFEIGAVETASGHCGVMTILDIYWERYYIGHSLMNDALMHPGEVVIPIYVPISFRVAKSLTVSGDMTFRQILTNAKTLAEDFGDRNVTDCNQPNPEIMLFNERDEDGYDYIVPKGWLTPIGATSILASGHGGLDPPSESRQRTGPSRLKEFGLDDSEQRLLDIGVPLPQSPKSRLPQAPKPPKIPAYQGKGPKPPARQPSVRSNHPGQRTRTPASFKSAVPLPSGGSLMQTNRAVHVDQPLTTLDEGKLGQPDSDRLTFKEKLKAFSGINLLTRVPKDYSRGNADGVENAIVVKTANLREMAPPPKGLGTLPEVPHHAIRPKMQFEEKKPMKLVAGSEPGSSESGSIKTWSDVPDDISDISVRDVNACMRLLNIDCQFVDVDGVFLQTLSEQDFTTYYKIPPTEAKKIVLFAKGWRLKV